MFKDAHKGEHSRFIAEKLCSTFAIARGTNKDNQYKRKMLGNFYNTCDCVHKQLQTSDEVVAWLNI